METIRIDHADTVQMQSDSAVPVLQQILTVLQAVEARLASLADLLPPPATPPEEPQP